MFRVIRIHPAGKPCRTIEEALAYIKERRPDGPGVHYAIVTEEELLIPKLNVGEKTSEGERQ